MSTWPVCPNCRSSVEPGSTDCRSCGLVFRGHYKPLWDVAARSEGWGLSKSIRTRWGFRVVCLLAPFWAPLITAPGLIGPPGAQALLWAPFVFLPGLYVLTNMPRWTPFVKVVASLSYVAASSVGGVLLLVHWVAYLRTP